MAVPLFEVEILVFQVIGDAVLQFGEKLDDILGCSHKSSSLTYGQRLCLGGQVPPDSFPWSAKVLALQTSCGHIRMTFTAFFFGDDRVNRPVLDV
jgi:hypothetical protein